MTAASGEIQLLVGFSKGSASNIVAQLIAPALSAMLERPVKIVQVAGENGALAAERLARADPDGGTLGMAVPTYLVGSLMGERPRYDPVADFSPVALIAKNPMVLAVGNRLGVQSVAELIALARAHNGELVYGASAIGGGPHLAALMFSSMAGIDMQLRVYAETNTLYDDLAAGRIALTFNNTMSALPLASKGTIKLLATTGPARSPVVPQLPTVAEAGFAGYAIESWVGLLAPAATPPGIVDHLNAAMARIVALPEVSRQLREYGMETVSGSPDYFGSHLAAELKRWVPFVRTHREAFPGLRSNRLSDSTASGV